MRDLIGRIAAELGFSAVGVTTAEPLDLANRLEEAIETGRIGAMSWLARNPNTRCDPAALLPGARSVICCAFAYGEQGISDPKSIPLLCKEGQGEVDRTVTGDLPHPSSPYKGEAVLRARFARGEDYHEVMIRKLKAMWETLRLDAPAARAKICVDSKPILEKALAQRAGLGWIGKHTILLNRELGSWFVLGEIVTDLELKPDEPAGGDCGGCRACMEACPTGALIAPMKLDARRCISYLTIEIGKARSPSTLHPPLEGGGKGEGKYGCDVCQEACPYNNG